MWITMRMYFATATGRYKSRKDYCRRGSYGTGQANQTQERSIQGGSINHDIRELSLRRGESFLETANSSFGR